VSVDALRGLNFIWILGIDGAMVAVAEMSRNKGALVESVGTFLGNQFVHPEWVGFRFYDLIFPLFIFITGASIVFSLRKLVEREGLRAAHIRVLRRFLLLYILGVLYYGGVADHFSDVRLVGVLQRIALCYLFASLLFLNLRLPSLIATFVVLVFGYWALMTFVPVPGLGESSYAPDANLANWIDWHYLPGRLWDGTRDPEGLLSTLPAIATCLLGVFAGLLLQDPRVPTARKPLWLVGAGLVMLAAGYVWSLQFPLIKPLWTSSFVLVTGGWSAILLGLAYQIVDVWQFKRWTTIFVWIGANAITLYFLNNVTSFERFAVRFVGGDVGRWLDAAITPGTGRFASHVLGALFAVALAGFLYRRRIFLRV
jgi:predicted acyltransferase